MRIGTKLGLLICGLLVAELATAGIGVGVVADGREHLHTLVAQQQRDTDLVLAVREGFQRQTTAWDRSIIDAADPRLAGRHRQTFDAGAESVPVLLDEIDAVSTDPLVRALNAQFRQVHDEITPQMRDDMAQARAGRYDPAAGARLEQDRAAALRLSDQQLDQVRRQAGTAIAEQERRSRSVVLAAGLTLVLLTLVLAGLGWRVAGRIVRPTLAPARQAAGDTGQEAGAPADRPTGMPLPYEPTRSEGAAAVLPVRQTCTPFTPLPTRRPLPTTPLPSRRSSLPRRAAAHSGAADA